MERDIWDEADLENCAGICNGALDGQDGHGEDVVDVVECLVLASWRHPLGHGGYLDLLQGTEMRNTHVGQGEDNSWAYRQQINNQGDSWVYGWFPLELLKPLRQCPLECF